MDSRIMTDIENYLDFLRKKGYMISISCFDAIFAPFLPQLYIAEVHLPQICSYLKGNENTVGLCSINKHRLQKKLPEKICYNCCYAGVEEYVVPCVADGKTCAIINISGYRSKLSKSIKRRDMYAQICGDEFLDLYNNLSDKVPNVDEIISLATPLCYMLCALFEQCKMADYSYDTPTRIYHGAVNYICNNYMNDIDISDVAKVVNYSPSYIRSVFKEKAGESFAKYLRNFRIIKSASLLKSTDMSITRIAQETGFCDSNYFSTVFTKHYGMSPKKYRIK